MENKPAIKIKRYEPVYEEGIFGVFPATIEMEEREEGRYIEYSAYQSLLSAALEMREALKFYSDRNNWKMDLSNETKDVIIAQDLGCKAFNGENEFKDYVFPSGGRLARETLLKFDSQIKGAVNE